MEAISGEIFLPDPIIQHIQSFLSGKEAARTTILSKSWYRAWSTRPNLHFDERNFETTYAFFLFAEKTLERYQILNLKIESLRLRMRDERDAVREVGIRASFAVANELIVKAMKMGVTDLDITVNSDTCSFVVPHEVLESESLIRLSVHGCEIRRGKISCSRLKSLSLFRVCIVGHLIWDIYRSCPLLENLSVSLCFLELHVPDRITLTMSPLGPFIEFGEQYVGSVFDGQISPRYEFHKLESLFLGGMDFDSSFFQDLSSKFPCLKDLALHGCEGCESIQISSPSLECLSFLPCKLEWAKFDVPNIRKFALSVSTFSCLCFKRKSEFDISLTYSQPTTSWFCWLKKFLNSFSMFKISLSLRFLWSSVNAEDVKFLEHIDPEEVKLLRKPVVENMTLCVHEPYLEVMDGLFSSCRPKFITPCSTLTCGANNFLVMLLCETLVEERSESEYIPNRSRLGLHDVEEVNVEVFEESVVEWQTLPWKTLLDASASPEINKQKIRFHLRWRVGD